MNLIERMDDEERGEGVLAEVRAMIEKYSRPNVDLLPGFIDDKVSKPPKISPIVHRIGLFSRIKGIFIPQSSAGTSPSKKTRRETKKTL